MTAEPVLNDLVPIPGVWSRLERVEDRLFEASLSDDGFLTKVAQHLLEAGGKRFRPLLALLAAEFGPGGDDRPVEAGVAVELIHVGSLYHDDVIDEADTRRGAASVNSNWTNTVAILAGDFLMARASEVAAARLGQESVRLLARTYAELVEGQTRELQLVGDLDHTVEDYYRVIGGKTASLIRTSARLGAMASDATDSAVEAVSTWAWELGLVFQMTDDALDLVGTEESIGKPAGSDIREGTFTLPVLLAREGPDGTRLRQLLLQSRPYPEPVVEEVIALVRAAGSVDSVLDEALRRSEMAAEATAALTAGTARDVLTTMGTYLVERVEAVRESAA
ncbi:MAG TPA: polyprenyl synthetase family protein [Acidimicrobiia bacterium]|nr:polyprenyl synthetase family protein [Acidimicrobiia bacterium]